MSHVNNILRKDVIINLSVTFSFLQSLLTILIYLLYSYVIYYLDMTYGCPYYELYVTF